MKTELNKLYENVRLLCYQLEHCKSDLNNQLTINSETESITKNKLEELLKTVSDDLYQLADFIYETLQNDDSTDLKVMLDCEAMQDER